MMFTKAIKSQSKLRCAIYGVAGSGKTFSSLSIASGLGNKVAVIDTEGCSASLYADKFDFDTCNLKNKKFKDYIDAINSANGKYDVLIIDSLTHCWQTALQELDVIARAKFKGNTWAAWSQITPQQTALINAILAFDGHVIATMRTKTEWEIVTSSDGKKTPVRIALAPEQGKGIEFEFGLLLEITPDHDAHAVKDRTGLFQDVVIQKPGKDFGIKLKEWLNAGAEPIKPTKPVEIFNLEERIERLKDCSTIEALTSEFRDSWIICSKTSTRENAAMLKVAYDLRKAELEALGGV